MDKGTCKEPGCEKPARTRGWCVMHYSRVQRTGTPNDPPPRVSKYDAICSEDGCENLSEKGARGLCPKHYYRQHKYGSTGEPPGRIFPSVEERFWSKVDKCGPVPPHMPHLGQCWLWTGALDKAGYGDFNAGERNIGAHRFAWELFNGPVPDGEEVCHACDTPNCVRGEVGGHLWTGTHAQNLGDARDKGRMPLFTASKPCGTMAAYYRHRRNDEEPCEACWEAVRSYDRARQQRRTEQARKRRESGT